MRRAEQLSTTLVAAMILAALVATHAASHPATERYIPIGRSPGSSQNVVTGVIEAVDVVERRIRLAGMTHWVRLTERTHIWLDRTVLSKGNLDGGFDDCKKGRSIEIRYEDEAHTTAAWIKIEMPLPGDRGHRRGGPPQEPVRSSIARLAWSIAESMVARPPASELATAMRPKRARPISLGASPSA
jgi:hypothetical protein